MPHERYRLEDGVHCIDVRLPTVETLFDNRDPAPFRDRDLDPGLVEYLRGGGEDLVGDGALRIVFWMGTPCEAAEIEGAVRAHFEYEIERLERKWRRAKRTSNIALAIGVVLLIALLSLAQLAEQAVGGSFGTSLHEGLTLLSWIVLWKPIEALLFDWLPVRRHRAVLAKLFGAAIEVRK